MKTKHGFHLFLALFIAAVFITACGSQGGSSPAASQYSNLATGSASLGADPTLSILHSFTGNPSDGRYPVAGLIMDNRGNLYGTTNEGGANNLGAIFKLDTSGTVTLLHSFGTSSDGYYPLAGLTIDHHGNLYGTTSAGGASSFGTVFKLDPSGTYTVLHSFAGGTADGATPYGSLIMDNRNNLYGTTSAGGASNDGTVFKLDTSGTLTLLHSFAGGATDGMNPLAGLIMDNKGSLYGTTYNGGVSNDGTVFKLDTSGTLTLLHSFAGGTTDGKNPQAGLIMDNKGDLYGTTYFGGTSALGTVFELDTSGTLYLLHSFAGGTTDGSQPLAGLITDNHGNLYGTTVFGGASNLGTAFKLDTSGTLTLLHSFAGGNEDGARPEAVLLRANKGDIFGTTAFGGDLDFGTVFELTQ